MFRHLKATENCMTKVRFFKVRFYLILLCLSLIWNLAIDRDSGWTLTKKLCGWTLTKKLYNIPINCQNMAVGSLWKWWRPECKVEKNPVMQDSWNSWQDLLWENQHLLAAILKDSYCWAISFGRVASLGQNETPDIEQVPLLSSYGLHVSIWDQNIFEQKVPAVSWNAFTENGMMCRSAYSVLGDFAAVLNLTGVIKLIILTSNVNSSIECQLDQNLISFIMTNK